jgi:GTP-sensing pleiotropic transcriptional regulator CodY
MTKREKIVKEVFKDLRTRIAGLPYVRNSLAVSEVKSLQIILDELESAFNTHIIGDDATISNGVVTNAIKTFEEQGQLDAEAIQSFLLSEYQINISLPSLKKRIEYAYGNKDN